MPAATNITCANCGRPLAEGEMCPDCSTQRSGFQLQPLFLLFLVLITAALFVFTALAARHYKGRYQRLAQHWYVLGEEALKHGRADEAISDLRNALYHSPDNRQIRLRLAEALAAAKRTQEAEAYLSSLWQDDSSDSTVNLQLARLAAQRSNMQEALRYYHGAIYGLWENDAASRRRAARLELIEFLLQRHAFTSADAELIALSAELPRRADAHAQTGWLFIRAGNYARALEQFRAALALNRSDASAMAGAGEAAFQLGQYRMAGQYLDYAVRLQPGNTHAAELLHTARLIAVLDPYERGLPEEDQARRTIAAYRWATTRLEDCANKKAIASAEKPAPVGGSQGDYQAALQRVKELKPKMRESTLLRDPDLVDVAMATVSQVEEVTAQRCGSPSGPDLALLLLLRKREAAER